jgi:hypothetical protein
MSSVLHFRPVVDNDDWGSCIMPLKAIFAKKFYDHDGTLGGRTEVLAPEHLDWLRGVKDSIDNGDNDDDVGLLNKIIAVLEDGGYVEMWFNV